MILQNAIRWLYAGYKFKRELIWKQIRKELQEELQEESRCLHKRLRLM